MSFESATFTHLQESKREMGRFNLVGVLVCLGGIAVTFSQTPIPSRPLGYVFSSPGSNPKVVLEIFYDHLCSDSKETWNEFMKDVLSDISSKSMDVMVIIHIFPLPYHHNAYFAQQVIREVLFHLCSDSKETWNEFMKDVLSDISSKSMDVMVIIHIFPLPYHHNAYFAQQVGVVVRDELPEKFKDYIQLIYDNQDMFLSGAVNMTEPQVKNSLAETAAKLGVDQAKIMIGFSDEVVVEKARYAWKYAASRGITGTPQYIVNGVNAPDAENYKKKDWEDFLSKLISSPY